jgi:hypothetical protein
MSNPAPQLVQKLWHYRNILHDDGLSYGDYVEQLTFLLLLKMAEMERRLAVSGWIRCRVCQRGALDSLCLAGRDTFIAN